MIQTQNFKDIVDQYKVIFFDAFGVIKNYRGLVPGMEKTFEYLDAEKKKYYIVTNDASRSPIQLADGFHKIGLPNIKYGHIISSGMLAKEYLDLKVHDGIVAYLGTTNSAHYIETSGLHTLPVSQINDSNIDQVNALVMLDDEGFNWFSDLNKVVNLLRRRNIPTIVANTDLAYPLSSKDVAIAIGGIANMIETILGKKFIRFGKPDSQMFMFAYDLVREKMPVGKKDILMVGDTLHTDILGGNKFGLDTVLVYTGNTLATEAETRINATGIVPTYICDTAVVDM
ncbi:HAD superfamily hydrolase (TIGR01459 family) [Mucilaginibacter gracilis]|uniref:HAD superfamily hydrolase (TIGR01459 family) n=1 Tax=Mucilaginibacter gracilis TaxID=423350 RepID=A0A495J5P6_9SPHI|nr:TIGR01459 family HAD-type hydrolase [Mucilaginibacter gracilis]RKR83748.1 HAD superfamily hydrolase (TIGR01459 family) [Mucilaginibacter gracilis]